LLKPVTDVEAKRFVAMEFAHAAHSAPTSGSSARPAINLVDELSPVDIQSLWKNVYGV
jgi:hypothetical protein